MMFKNRRTFLKRCSALLASAGLLSITTKTHAEMTKKNRFIHNVYFWLKNPDSAEDAAKLAKGIQSLSKVKTVQDFFLGRPAPTNRPVIDSSYSYHLMLAFDNLEDQNAYQTDPIHLQFVKDCEQLWQKVQVYDSDASLVQI